MSITTLSVKYRPLRIGFLVRDGSFEDLVTAAGINTMLWGGIYNPIIPISEGDNSVLDDLINLFSVDILYPVTHTDEIDKVLEDNPFLASPKFFTRDIFYDNIDGTQNIGILDSINIVQHHWEKEFKYKSKKYKSNFSFVKWDNADIYNILFSLSFGYFPKSYNLADDYEEAFIKGLKSNEVNITNGGIVNHKISEFITPIKATALELYCYFPKQFSNGIYVGSENSYTDLVYFWNLRASGFSIEFLPQNNNDRYKDYLKAHVKELEKKLSSTNPHEKDQIVVYSFQNYETVSEVIKDLFGKQQFVYSKCGKGIWKQSSFSFDYQKALASVDNIYNKYRVSFSLPEKRFFSEPRHRDVHNQELIISMHAITEFEYSGRTLNPPFLRELNEFYSREISIDPWKVRSELQGIGIIIDINESSLSLYPILHQELIERIFNLAGYKTSVSQAGLLTKQIISNMKEIKPLDACRVFKITGIRKLLNSIKANDTINWSSAISIIGSTNFNKFKKLYIESRKKPELTPIDAFRYLLAKKIFIPVCVNDVEDKIDYKCENCGLKENIMVKSFENSWCCPYCEHKQYLPPHIIENFRNKDTFWLFKKGGLFGKDNNQEGAVPVILSLLILEHTFFSHELIYSTSLNLQKTRKCEIDFCVLDYSNGKIELGIAECKSEGQKINQNDIDNLVEVQKEIEKLKISCYIIISKTADSFEDDEIEILKNIPNKKLIILTNSELESYRLYEDIENKDTLPEPYTSSMSGISRNSVHLYLNDK